MAEGMTKAGAVQHAVGNKQATDYNQTSKLQLSAWKQYNSTFPSLEINVPNPGCATWPAPAVSHESQTSETLRDALRQAL